MGNDREQFLNVLRQTYATPQPAITRDGLKESLGKIRAERAQIVSALGKARSNSDPVQDDLATRQELYKMRIG